MLPLDIHMVRVICRVQEIDSILEVSDQAKKNSKLHHILNNLKVEIEVSHFVKLQYLAWHTKCDLSKKPEYCSSYFA